MSSSFNKTQQQIFISGLVYDQGKSGIAEYTNQLTAALCKHNTVTLALLRRDTLIFPCQHENLTIINVSNVFAGPVMNILWHLFLLPFILMFTNCTSLILPAINRRLCLWSPKPVLGVVHDLSQYAVEGKYDISRTLYVKFLLPMALPYITHIVAISHNTKKDVIKYWNLSDEKISVCYNGYDNRRYQENRPKNIPQVLEKHAITQPYLLYVSRIEHPGKNHIQLIKALEMLSPEQTKDLQIIFAGGDWNGAEQVKKYVSNSPLANKIQFLGYVLVEELPALYHGALASVIPSLYEGFGIPLVEAMACATPTLCSNNSALNEVAGNAALTFNPRNVKDISQKLSSILQHKQLRTELSQKGLQRCQHFSWNRLATHIGLKLEMITYPFKIQQSL